MDTTTDSIVVKTWKKALRAKVKALKGVVPDNILKYYRGTIKYYLGRLESLLQENNEHSAAFSYYCGQLTAIRYKLNKEKREAHPNG